MIILHLIHFETTTTYTLELDEGRMEGNSWRTRDENGDEIEEITSFTIKSSKSSEAHEIVLNRENEKDTTLAIVAVKHE